MSAIPRRTTAEPPSGTAEEFPAEEFAKNEDIVGPLFWVVKLHVIAVGVNPLPLTTPVPSMARTELVCIMTVDESRSKVKPATLHKAGTGVDGLNCQGAVKVTAVFTGIPAKSPVLPASTWGLSQAVTAVAVPKGPLSVTAPAKLMIPFIGVACLLTEKRAAECSDC